MAQIIQKLKIKIGNSQLRPWSYVCGIILGLQTSYGESRTGRLSTETTTEVHNWTYSIISIVLTTLTTMFYSVIGNAAPLVNGDKICNHAIKTSNRLCSQSDLQVARTQVRQSDTLTSTLFDNLYGKNNTFDGYENIADFFVEADVVYALSSPDFQQSDFFPCKNGEIIHVNFCVLLPLKISQVGTQFLSQSNSEENNISQNTQPENTQQQDPPPVEGQPNLPTNSPTETTPLTEPLSAEEEKIERLRRILRNHKKRTTQPASQGELGNLRVREVEPSPSQQPTPLSPQKPVQRTTQPASQRELGNLRVRKNDPPPLEQPTPLPPEKPVVKKRQPTPQGYLITNLGYFFSSNVFSSKDDPIEDSLFYSGLTLASAPLRLGKKTSVNGSIDGYLIRYINQSDFDYNQIRFNVNLYHRLASQTYGRIGWTHQNLFYARNGSSFAAGDRFLSEHSLRLSLSRRDSITPKLILDSFYEFRYSFASPDSRNRAINSLWLSLNYRWQKPLQVGLNYQFNLSDFTMRDRNDNYHRLYGNINYAISKSSRISLQSGFALGSSTDNNIDFDGWFLSLNYNLRLGKF